MPSLTPLNPLPTARRAPLVLRRTLDLDATTMVIRLSTGTGTGRTALSAFDDALLRAGIANYNLVRLSSVIPPRSVVSRVDPHEQLVGGWGDRLYCVYASQPATIPGQQAWAGIGWSLRDDGSGAGVFVEHEGEDERSVREDIERSLEDLARRRGAGFTPGGMVMTSAVCEAQPVCALVVAAYETAAWHRA